MTLRGQALFFSVVVSVFWTAMGIARNEGFGCWALLTSRDVQETGLSDLLSAELTRGTNIVWLERDALTTVVKELEFSQLTGANGALGRLALGRQLGADALLLAVGIPDANPPVIRVVMADCHSGARLDAREYPASASAKSLCKLIVRQFGDMHARFPHGVERVVGLAPFRSRNLLYDYDALQARYAELLTQTLSREPGLAVLAVEEARAIGVEKAVQGSDIVRMVPLIVEGEFRMTREAAGTGTVAEVSVRLTSASGVQNILSGPKPLSAVPGWLITELAAKVLARSGVLQGVTAKAQAVALTGQADAFDQLGDYARAAALRESAILLLGDACEQRLRVLDDYHHLIQEGLGLPSEEYRPDSARLHAAATRRVETYVVGLEHLEYLIRHALMGAEQAINLVSRWTTDNFTYGLPSMVTRHNGAPWRVGKAELSLAEEAEERFMTQTYLLVRTLPGGEFDQPEGPQRMRFLNKWVLPLWKSALTRKQRSFYSTKEDLDFFLRVVTQLVPDGLDVRNQALPELQPRQDLWGPDAASPEEFKAFLGALASSTNRMLSIQGRYALYYEKWLEHSKNPEALARLRPDVERLYADFKAYCKESISRNSNGSSYMLDRARDLLRNVSPPTPAPNYQPPPKPVRPNMETDTGALRITPLTNLTIQLRSGKFDRWFDKTSFPFIREWVRCDDGLDVLWGEQTVLFLGTDRVLDTVIWESNTSVGDVVWDGAHVWVAMPSKGILKFDTAGRQVGAVGREQGLPPSDGGLMLHPLGPDRLVAVGSFGSGRAWCARVEWTNSPTSQVSVFHEATRILRRDENVIDAQQVFSPHWLHAYHAKGDKADPVLLVGRAAHSLAGLYYPLKINLRTFEVSVFDCELTDAGSHDDGDYFSRDGFLLEGWQYKTLLRIPASLRSQDEAGWRSIPLSNPAPVNMSTGWLDSPEKVTQVGGQGSCNSIVLADDGWVYVPGKWWYRIDPRTWTGQRLTSYQLPLPFFYEWRLWNTRFGLVGQCCNRLYQIRIDETAIPAAGSVMDL